MWERQDHVPSDEREGKRLKDGTDGWIDDDGMVCGEDMGRRYQSPITRSIGNAQLKRAGILNCRAEVSRPWRACDVYEKEQEEQEKKDSGTRQGMGGGRGA